MNIHTDLTKIMILILEVKGVETSGWGEKGRKGCERATSSSFIVGKQEIMPKSHKQINK